MTRDRSADKSDSMEKSERRHLPAAGDVIHNPVHGETMRFLEVADYGDDTKLRVEATVAPQASGPPPHVHPHSSETFEVLSGAMKLKAGREELVLAEGQSRTVGPNTAHKFWNHSDEQAVVLIEWDPGMEMALFLDRWFQLARDGHLNDKGMSTPLQTAVLFDAYLESIAIPVVPIAVQKRLFRTFARWGARRGYTS